jgi:hydrogenase expression/formation protein HypE
MEREMPDGFTCPSPLGDHSHVQLAHGGGGRLTNALIEGMFAPAFDADGPERRHDGAAITIGGARLAFTTDSYVVDPLFFPGGSIGYLAVNGTVNDLAMCGARPLYLSVGMIIEEGLPMETLWRVTQDMKRAADAANVKVVTGDTKVLDRGKGDGLFINTAGIGLRETDADISPSSVRPGDAVLLSGDIARHGMAVMTVREGLEFDTTIESDCAPLAGVVLALFEAGIDVRCMRDLTRGGLASALVEIAEARGVHVVVRESAVPVLEDVRGACEILGLDPMYVANEGRFIAIVGPEDADAALDIMTRHAVDGPASRIGEVTDRHEGLVTVVGQIGAERVLDMLSGEQLPRIC